MNKSFADAVKEKIIHTMPPEKLGGISKVNKKHYSHICKDLKDNFIDGQVLEKCNVKGELFAENIKYHMYSTSLNSSQVMCISFFKKFLERPEHEMVLLNILIESGLGIEEDVYITNAIFEYEPKRSERTNFDFYMILSSGQHISFEVKYTESDFGGISRCSDKPDKYRTKWEECYLGMVEKSPYLNSTGICNKKYACVKCGKLNPSICGRANKCDIYNFYRFYQINRNISYARNPNDIVVFLTPAANHELDNGRAYIDKFCNSNIINIYWEKLLEKVNSHLLGGTELSEYYKNFKNKYFDFIPLENNI